jgi:hypothetical protein
LCIYITESSFDSVIKSVIRRYRILASKIGRRADRPRPKTDASCRYSMGLISFTKKGKLTEQIEDDTIPRYLNTVFLREVQY